MIVEFKQVQRILVERLRFLGYPRFRFDLSSVEMTPSSTARSGMFRVFLLEYVAQERVLAWNRIASELFPGCLAMFPNRDCMTLLL